MGCLQTHITAHTSLCTQKKRRTCRWVLRDNLFFPETLTHRAQTSSNLHPATSQPSQPHFGLKSKKKCLLRMNLGGFIPSRFSLPPLRTFELEIIWRLFYSRFLSQPFENKPFLSGSRFDVLLGFTAVLRFSLLVVFLRTN